MILVIFQGDNLAIHEIMALKQIFHSKNCCRYCYCNHSDFQTLFKYELFEDYLRDDQDYEKPHLWDEKNIKSRDVFRSVKRKHRIPDFDLIKSLPCDPFHDLEEGVIVRFFEYFLSPQLFGLKSIKGKDKYVIKKIKNAKIEELRPGISNNKLSSVRYNQDKFHCTGSEVRKNKTCQLF